MRTDTIAKPILLTSCNNNLNDEILVYLCVQYVYSLFPLSATIRTMNVLMRRLLASKKWLQQHCEAHSVSRTSFCVCDECLSILWHMLREFVFLEGHLQSYYRMIIICMASVLIVTIIWPLNITYSTVLYNNNLYNYRLIAFNKQLFIIDQ